MLVTVSGIVIGKRDIGENNCFLDVLTDKYGVIEATAHGVKKLNSKNASSAGLFSYSKFCFNKTDLRYTLNSAEPVCSFFGLSADLKKFSLAVYLAEIIKYTSASEQNGEDILRFFAITLYELERENADCGVIKAAFEFRIAAMLGFLPDLRACRGCGEYLNGKMYFSSEGGNLVCEQCKNREDNIYEELKELLPDLLHTMRFVVYSAAERVYGFTLKGKTRKEFSAFAEEYLLTQLGRGFKTLDYYKKLI
ncbi:MAG: DNA repair protein RecO [Bacteroides sp.]|nr:DNA repair protein RecO [Bacteroides sp.]